MSPTVALLAFFGIWAACGVIASIAMGRRGHAPVAWLLVGAALGPLVLVGAREAVQREGERGPQVVARGSRGSGSVSVLVGLDGSVAADAALDAIVDLLGPRLGRLELATVADFDVEPGTDESAACEALLESSSARVRGRIDCEPASVVLVGPPAVALVSRAGEGAFDYLAIGRHGRGASTAVLGNVAKKISATSTVPVVTISTNT